jgi:hypothetical protein
MPLRGTTKDENGMRARDCQPFLNMLLFPPVGLRVVVFVVL